MSDRRRRLSAFCWLAIAAVIFRAASGGGGGGFFYVATEEPRASYVTGAVILAVAAALSFGFAVSRSMVMPRLSATMSPAVALYAGWWYVLDDHTSGLVLGAAAASAFGLAAPVLRRDLIDRRAHSKSRQHPNPPQGDR